MVQAIAINTQFHNLSNEQLADAIGQADAALKGAVAEVAALKSEFRGRGLRVVAGGHFTVTALDQICGRLDVAAVKIFLGDAWRQFETANITAVIRIDGQRIGFRFSGHDKWEGVKPGYEIFGGTDDDGFYDRLVVERMGRKQ